jgi:hypothetical protein
VRSAAAASIDTDFPFGANVTGFSHLDKEFAEFHLSNPQVYGSLVKLAREAKAAGKEKVGIGMLFEVCRWEFFLQTTGGAGFKLNNNHRSRYARLIMRQEPDLATMFDIRELRS